MYCFITTDSAKLFSAYLRQARLFSGMELCCRVENVLARLPFLLMSIGMPSGPAIHFRTGWLWEITGSPVAMASSKAIGIISKSEVRTNASQHCKRSGIFSWG